MLVKIVNNAGTTRMHECRHYAVTVVSNDSVAASLGADIGIHLELSGGERLSLPRDGQAIYVMNDAGDTVDAYRWPPREVDDALQAAAR